MTLPGLSGFMIGAAVASTGAFPAITGTPVRADFGGSGTSFNITLPSGVSAGETLLMYVAVHDAGTSTMSGWTNLHTGTHSQFVYAKIAAGGETTATLVTSVSTTIATICYRISGGSALTLPEASTGATGTSTAPNPDSFTPSFGAKNILWFAFYSDPGFAANTTGFPASYALGHMQEGAGVAAYAGAARQLNAATEDPGAFTMDSSVGWAAITAAVSPT